MPGRAVSIGRKGDNQREAKWSLAIALAYRQARAGGLHGPEHGRARAVRGRRYPQVLPASPAANSEQSILTLAVEEYCRDCGIVDEQERAYVVQLVRALSDLGATDSEALRGGPEDAMGAAARKA